MYTVYISVYINTNVCTVTTCISTVFLTHRPYLGGLPILTAAQGYLVTHFCFYYYYYLLHFHEQLNIVQSPLARTAHSVCSRTVDTPTDNLQCFPYVHLIVAGRNNIHHQLPRLSHTSATLALYLATFRTFWRLLFHIRYILTTNLVTFGKKIPLAIIQL